LTDDVTVIGQELLESVEQKSVVVGNENARAAHRA
jgi:hypothetical protein